VIDWARRHAARPLEVDADLTRIWAPAEERYDTALDRAMLVDAMRSLSPMHREALIRVHYEDRTHAEVASTLGLPAGTVKSRAHYAIRELRRVLSDAGMTERSF
jgi:RNA polymerase sigma-70 factor (ECF subfamily)